MNASGYLWLLAVRDPRCRRAGASEHILAGEARTTLRISAVVFASGSTAR